MFTLMLFMAYGHPPHIDWYKPFYTEKGLTRKQCERRGNYYVKTLYQNFQNIEYVCATEHHFRPKQ